MHNINKNVGKLEKQTYISNKLFYRKLKIIIQSPLTSLRTYHVTHFRFVTHFRILKFKKKKISVVFIVAQIRFIVYF